MAHKAYGLNELREMYLKFFESKGHLRLPSFSLVPQNDKSILLINAGMTPMKPWFTGEEEPPRHRVTTCQKCIRTGDIENVGHTARHGTYFEMLGNFSFGDYFKKEAIPWAWEFLTSPEWVGLEPDRLYPSVFEGNETTPADDEAFAIWRDDIGIPENRIFRFGKEDNFWEHGSGPCGPCSEIYYDRGAEYGCGKPGCTVGCDCDRYVEVWNIVFSQFNNDGHGHYEELKQKNIDTGMGLERLACVCQNVNSLFDVDTVMNITNKVSELTGAHYGESQKTDVSLRVITDHIRSSTFMICDGILPSNEGRGYVLRRLLRRAARHGKLLGVNEPEKRIKQYPFELSGGMRQRVMIAMALACEPDILIADEPTTALDVTIQAQILELMQDLQKKLGMAVILVTHDLGVIADMCDNIIVMYGGRICERGTAREIFYNPKHEYTKGLLRSIPNVNNMKKKLVPIAGTPINMLNLPAGCAFCTRCDAAMKICLTEHPDELTINENHKAACWVNIRDRLMAEGGEGNV